jgi:CheY-like chemotaxis protein
MVKSKDRISKKRRSLDLEQHIPFMTQYLKSIESIGIVMLWSISLGLFFTPEFDVYLIAGSSVLTLGLLAIRFLNVKTEPPAIVPQRGMEALNMKKNGVGVQYQGSVLVVEDSEASQKLITLILQQFGLSVDLASSGEEALKQCQYFKYDLILMDMNMPGMDGPTTSNKIRLSDQSNANTTIIALTANTSKAHQNKCMENGMNGFLNKPLEIKSFITVLDHIFLDSK